MMNVKPVNKKSLKSAILMMALVAAPGIASAAGDAAAGKARAAVCGACHGANGVSAIPSYPNLAGQKAAYLESSLKAYKSRQRSGGQAAIMQGQAMALSDTDIANLAAYFSSL